MNEAGSLRCRPPRDVMVKTNYFNGTCAGAAWQQPPNL